MTEFTKNNNNEISLKELIFEIKFLCKAISIKWKYALLVLLIGSSVGFIYASKKPIIYTAQYTYLLEKTNNEGSGNLGLLASQFGINVGAGSTKNELFSSLNLNDLMKSRMLVEKILLKPVQVDNERISLADFYIKINKNNNWFEGVTSYHPKFLPNSNPDNFTKEQVVLLKSIYLDLISDSKLSFENNKNKKSSFSCVIVNSKNEKFAKYFSDFLIKYTSEYYIETQNRKARENVENLKMQLDSVRQLFNNAVSEYAKASDQTFNMNQSLKVKATQPLRKQVDVQANTTLLTSLITNLELAKANLKKETPLFQVIDKPILPLDAYKPNRIKFAILGGLCFLILYIFFIISRIFIKKYLLE
jgi:uncharacterized protein involved in exopolysaccharide biosynthesis